MRQTNNVVLILNEFKYILENFHVTVCKYFKIKPTLQIGTISIENVYLLLYILLCTSCEIKRFDVSNLVTKEKQFIILYVTLIIYMYDYFKMSIIAIFFGL